MKPTQPQSPPPATDTTKHPNPLGLPERKKAPWLKILLGVIALVVIIIAALAVWFMMMLSATRNDVPVNGEVIEVSENSSLEAIASQLADRNLIVDKNVFVLWAKFGTRGGRLKPGPYLIKPSSSIRQIVANMSGGKIAVNKITYPEGITIAEMAKRWESAGYGTKEDYIAATKKLAPAYDFIPASAKTNPEGYLFPATYTFTYGSSAEVLVGKQYDAFAAQAEPILEGTRPAGLNPHQTLTLASIVEKEALTETDRKLVAGVFLNRLKLGMKFESDVTVNYATGKTITLPSDLSVNSPYNTYLVRGLPPTPINNPSTDAIEAAMNPSSSDFIFFLAGNDGKVYYAQTLAEHNQNIKKYLEN